VSEHGTGLRNLLSLLLSPGGTAGEIMCCLAGRAFSHLCELWVGALCRGGSPAQKGSSGRKLLKNPKTQKLPARPTAFWYDLVMCIPKSGQTRYRLWASPRLSAAVGFSPPRTTRFCCLLMIYTFKLKRFLDYSVIIVRALTETRPAAFHPPSFQFR
jgi:hypothetical protein